MKRFYSAAALLVLLAFAAILTVFSSKAQSLALEALVVCAKSIVPSLFPYMVISSMIVSSGASSILGRAFPISRIFGLPSCASGAVILGYICGFPVGAKATTDLYKKGLLTKKESEVLISVANNTGPSFIVSVIGASFFKSISFGWKLYCFQIISSITAGILINRIVFPIKGKNEAKEKVILTLPHLPSALTDSVNAVMTVCGFIVFFSVITGLCLPNLMKISPTFAATVCAVLEFCGGTRLSAALGGAVGTFLCGLSVGWSGISVLLQTYAFTSHLNISLTRTVAAKAVQGVLCGILCAAFSPDIQGSAVSISPFEAVSLFHINSIETIIISTVLYIYTAKNFIKRYKI